MNRRVVLLAGGVAIGLLGLALWASQRGPAAAPKQLVFVSNYAADTVSVIDAATQRVVTTIPVPEAPMGLALRDGAEPLLAVAQSTGRGVALIDPLQLAVVGTLAVPKGPEFVAFSPDGALLYVTSPYELNVTVFDVATRASLGELVRFDRKPGSIRLSPDGRRLYVLVRDTKGRAVAVDTQTRQIVGEVPVGKFPSDLGLSGDARHLLAASFDDNTVTVIDTASFQAVATHAVDTGMGIVVHPEKPLVYSMVSFDDRVAVLNYESGEVAGDISLGKWPTYGAITADGRMLFVPSEESDNLAMIDTETNSIVHRIVVGREPAHVAIFER